MPRKFTRAKLSPLAAVCDRRTLTSASKLRPPQKTTDAGNRSSTCREASARCNQQPKQFVGFVVLAFRHRVREVEIDFRPLGNKGTPIFLSA